MAWPTCQHSPGVTCTRDVTPHESCQKGSSPESPWTTLNKVKEALQRRFPKTSEK